MRFTGEMPSFIHKMILPTAGKLYKNGPIQFYIHFMLNAKQRRFMRKFAHFQNMVALALLLLTIGGVVFLVRTFFPSQIVLLLLSGEGNDGANKGDKATPGRA